MSISNSAHTQEYDPRMTITIENQTNVNQSMKLAIEQLWQRLVPIDAIPRIPPTTSAKFLPRIQQLKNGLQIHFDADRVWSFLNEKNIPSMREPQPMHLQLSVYHAYGLAATELTTGLQNYAEQVTPAWGIQLQQENNNAISLLWEWRNDGEQVHLTISHTNGQPSHDEIRTISSQNGHAIEALQAWLLEILLHEREVLWQRNQQNSLTEKTFAEPIRNFTLSIARNDDLASQVALEDALMQLPQVLTLTPIEIDQQQRKYIIKIRGFDLTWLSVWLNEHGLEEVTFEQDGWHAQ
ncbi:MAG: hypothetical protein HQM07_03305 [Zetaproteobacteria bacterium]|nr:hypothetical protein [Zetaproteobacteria bacterium]